MGAPVHTLLLRHAAICLLTAAFAALLITDQARAGSPTAPLNGTFESCSPDRPVCVERLAVARDMGFGLVINGAGLQAGPDAARQYAEAAQQLGLRVAWPLSNEGWWVNYDPAAHNLLSDYQGWADGCARDLVDRGSLTPGNECDNEQLLQFIVTTLAQLPSTWGWYAADDLQLRQADTVGPVEAWTRRLKALAPDQKSVISVWNTMGLYRGAADFVAQESYPFGVPQQGVFWPDIAALARDTQRLTRGSPSAFILQGFSWGDNMWDAEAVGGCAPTQAPQDCLPRFRYPTAAEQLHQRQTILLNSRPGLLLWYGLWGTLGPPDPRPADPSYSDPTPAEASSRMRSLSAAVLAPPPRTRVCLRLSRHSRRWTLDARASRAVGGVHLVRWHHRGWRQQGRGLRISLRAARKHPAAAVSLLVRDGYAGRTKVRASLSTRHTHRLQCRRSSALERW